MQIFTTEARITKTNKIIFGSDVTSKAKYYTIINPIKGSYEDLEDRLYKILKTNTPSILELIISHKKIYIAYIESSVHNTEDFNVDNCILYYDREDAINDVQDTHFRWHQLKSKIIYPGIDISISGVIRRWK